MVSRNPDAVNGYIPGAHCIKLLPEKKLVILTGVFFL